MLKNIKDKCIENVYNEIQNENMKLSDYVNDTLRDFSDKLP